MPRLVYSGRKCLGSLLNCGLIPVLMAILIPGFVGHRLSTDSASLSTMELPGKGLPLAALIAIVLGGIYTGWITPVGAGAVGSIGAMLLATIRAIDARR